MKQLIMIRYAELSTKKDNIIYFLDILESNIKKTLKDINVKVIKYKSRMYIDFFDYDSNIIIEKLRNVPGIMGISLVYGVKTNIDDICIKTLELAKNKEFVTFKINTKRVYKNITQNSMDINNIVGEYILNNTDKKVDVHNPDLVINIELRDKENTYIYLNEHKGLGGYPVGSNGRGLLMLSGGIDSPVAGYLSIKRGIALDAIYFESMPHTSLDARNKVISLCKILNNYSHDINLYVIPFTKIQESIYKNIDKTYLITIMRRMMYRITSKLCDKLNTKIIINGESIGQVSSQTLSNIFVINSVTNIPVIRPLACMDKTEIISIATSINTYGISILPYEDCCTIFVPDHPVINPTLEKCVLYESNIDYETMINECIDNVKIINISEYNNFKELL